MADGIQAPPPIHDVQSVYGRRMDATRSFIGREVGLLHLNGRVHDPLLVERFQIEAPAT
jgi:hypothetical protein